MRRTKGGRYILLYCRFNRATRSITEVNQAACHGTEDNKLYRRPGPGSYSIELRKNDKLVTFPHSKRFSTEILIHPGPGFYKSEECSKEKIKAGVLARSERITIKSNEKRPGPGDYSMPKVSSYKKKEPSSL